MKKYSRFKRHSLALAVSGVMSMGATGVIAQEKSWAIEEVTVTAQKREQSLQDVPISVSAFSGEMMKDAQIEDSKQLAVLTPGMSGDSNDSFMDSINIRGISTNGFGIGAEPSIGIYNNGVYLGRTGAAVTSLYDMERVEVVKGPQGTLFGRNASAGAISMHTRKADSELGGSVNLGLGQDGYREFTGVVNVPMTDTLNSRFAMYHRQQDDWVTNLTDGGKIGGEEVTAVRASFAYTGDNLSADLVLEYEDREVAPTIYRAYDDGTEFSTRLGLLDASLTNIGGKEDEIRSDVASNELKDEGEVWGATLNLEYELGDGYSLSSITGIRGSNYTYQEDFDGTDTHLFNWAQDQEQEYYSQEVRLNYNGDGPVSWFLGASAYKEEVKVRYDQTYDEDAMCASSFAGAYAPEYADPAYAISQVSDCDSLYYYWYYTSPGPGIGERNDSVDAEGDYEGWGIYGDATFSPTDKLDITVGARYTEDSRDFQTALGGEDRNYFWYSFPFYSSQPVKGSQTWENVSARVAVNYYLTDNISTFVNVSTGYKAGGFNTFDLQLPAGYTSSYEEAEADPSLIVVDGDDTADIDGISLSEFDEETVTSFELGIKSKWWDDRIQMDASIYQYQFEGMHAVYAIDGTQIRLTNVGDATGEGVEVSFRILPTANLDIYWGIAWADTSLDDPDADFCTQVDCRKGAQLPGTIDFSSSLVATYSIPMNTGEAYVTLENFYNSGAPGFGDFSGSSVYETESFKETNLRIGFRSNDAWSATFWVTNLTDEFAYGSPVAGDYNLPAHTIGMTEPRRIGVSASYEF
ncbi:TonB-dependent receptor [Aestuariicella hydrocarbonica]|uniref:TonB-dependent receptor n=1 Tax=Pseudomaricurvus hydrocarbonicus TaxID=1470433 RepID=A0A9E5MPA7_9GAMM|nr:TonB-dependent receptor [Aestuariicella hydrocarbonica]NHO67900.1 TonB-dependent receptor [Aestuariicella hydrocarbonica]